MNKKTLIYAAFGMLLTVSCGKGSSKIPDGKYMATDDIETVESFPETIELPAPQAVKIGKVGINGFKVMDSTIVISTKGNEGILSFYRKSNLAPLGSFLNIGNSKAEVTFPPAFYSFINFYRKSDSLYVDIYDMLKKRMLTFNVDESLKNKQAALKAENTNFEKTIFSAKRLPDGKYLIKELNDNQTMQTRSIVDLKSGNVTITSLMKKLNDVSVKEGEDFNIISTITQVGKDGRIFEMPIGLNYINIYTPDGSFAKTICTGDKPDDIDNITKTNKWKRKYTFADIKVFGNFFGVVKIDEEEGTYQTKRTKKPSILLFTLDGEPLAEIKLKRQITSFDIDQQNNILYTFDSETEEFMKYDISKWLPALVH